MRSTSGVTLVDRQPPQDIEAEQAVLGSMLLSPEAADAAFSRLRPADFYRPAHERIFAAMTELAASLMPVDHVSVSDRLGADLPTVGGKPYLLELAGAVPTTANVAHYAEIVMRTARQRRIIAEATRVVGAAYDGEDPDTLSSELYRAAEAQEPTTGRISTFAEVLSGMDLTATVEHFTSEILPHVYMQRGDFVLLGSRPSIGKTAFALQLAEELARRHVRVRYYSHEMGRERLVRRCIQRHTGYDLPKQMRGLTAEEQDGTKGVMAGDWQSFIEIGDANPSLTQVCSETRQFARRGGSVVIIDHLHILVNGSDRMEVSQATRMLKMASNDGTLNPKDGRDKRPVIFCLAQFTRLEKREDGTFRPPTIQSFKESGTAEADADIAILLHRYDRRLDEKARDSMEKQGYLLAYDWQRGVPPHKDLCHVEVAKNRDFKCDRYPAWFDGADVYWSFLDRLEDS